jgi:uncharacterized membrane protein YgdD (TMEM256/DUF423 family)
VQLAPSAATARAREAGGQALALAGVLLALATVCGAYGVHALRNRLPPARLELWDTAVRYHFFQCLGLLGVGLLLRALGQEAAAPRAAAALQRAAALNALGVLRFSGSLYALALGAPRAVGLLTPLGGIASIAAWLLFAFGAWRARG